MSKAPKDASLPPIGRLWRKAYNAVPIVYLPGTHMRIGFSFCSAMIFLCLRLTSQHILETSFGWPKTNSSGGRGASSEGAASVVGVFHSTVLLSGLVAAFSSRTYHPSEAITAAPRNWQDVVNGIVQFCTGYMIYDSSFILLSSTSSSSSYIPHLSEDDCLFLVHHVMIILYLTSNRYYGAGHVSAAMNMLLGEMSNPIHNIYLMARLSKNGFSQEDDESSPSSTTLYAWIELIFALTYLSLRTCIGPIVCSHMSWDLLVSKDARRYIPLFWRILYCLMIWAVILGSYSWVLASIDMVRTSPILFGTVEVVVEEQAEL